MGYKPSSATWGLKDQLFILGSETNKWLFFIIKSPDKIHFALLLWKTWLNHPFLQFASLAGRTWVTSVPFGEIFLVLCLVPSLLLDPMQFTHSPGHSLSQSRSLPPFTLPSRDFLNWLVKDG